MNWRDISYLRLGSPEQQRAFKAVSELGILTILRSYDAVLVSTVCLDIATATSDLDIICEVHDHGRFIADVARYFGGCSGFSTKSTSRVPPATVVQFFTREFEFEIFGQALAVERQAAYQHLCQTYRIIQLGGEACRSAIQQLKQNGMKTEPAVAHLLALPGDPYVAVLDLCSISDDDLRAKIAQAGLLRT